MDVDDLLGSGHARLDAVPRPGRMSSETITGFGLPPLATALVLLWHDHLDAAHVLVQAAEGDPDADLIHAWLHRREGDAANSRYWLRVSGKHPFSGSDPDGFVAEVARAVAAGRGDDAELTKRQRSEFRALLANLLKAGEAAPFPSPPSR